MWKSVPVRDSHFQQTRRRPSSSSKKATESVATTPSLAPPADSGSSEDVSAAVTVQERNTLANRLKKIAQEISAESWVQAMVHRVSQQLQRILSEAQKTNPEETSNQPHVVGLALGIGNLSDPQCMAQMGCFLSLFHCLGKNSSLAGLTWELRYYDPVASPLDIAVCEKLGICFEKFNCFCAYRASRSSTNVDKAEVNTVHCDALVAFMPHCGLTLYSNILASNCFENSLCDRLVLIGNDLSTYRDRTCLKKFDFFHRLYPYLSIDRLYETVVRKQRKLECRISGLGFSDIDDAFSDLSLILVKDNDELCDLQPKSKLLEDIQKRPPKLFLSSDEQ